ncbi:serine/threonine-protein kinase [Sphaerisporangium fuscum]|uniref:serine/threonine-protein kinase n=1 Tax=Sphaerisporangium fuscum TaxID=2835868 RepID=UPI001BDCED56|nr:serine/threonine-protein kinase [Sphaerisporangium fuscum]
MIIGRYLLLGRLGAGGMGVVYLAERPEGGLVALKTPHALHLADPTLRARFAEEVRFSHRVVPFCTAAVLEDGVDRDRPYLVTEHIPGPSLAQVVSARGPLTPDLAYGVALGSAAALVAIHDAGFVHRDLKPGNVLLSPHGPRVIDFGIARDLDAAVAHTQAGQIMGSPGWVAPERLTGGPAIPASDVFAWGCLVAYAATGHHPFGRGEVDVLTRRILVEEPRLVSVPRLLIAPVSAALAKEPERRPDAVALLAWLLRAGGVDPSWGLREAVAAVLEEIWAPVPHPADAGALTVGEFTGDGAFIGDGRAAGSRAGPWYGGAAADARPYPTGPAYGGGAAGDGRAHPTGAGYGGGASRERGGDGVPTGGGASGAAATTGARTARRSARRGHVSHAGFAALATVSIAAMTVVAAGGGTKVDPSSGHPQQVPVVVPVDGSRVPLKPRDSPAPGVTAAARHEVEEPDHPSRITPAPAVITTRPPRGRATAGGTPVPDDPWRTPLPSPSRQRTTSRPPEPQPQPSPTCTTKRGKEKPCGRTKDPDSGPTGRPSPTKDPRPTVSVSQIPEWGDGESGPPTPAPTLSDSPSA